MIAPIILLATILLIVALYLRNSPKMNWNRAVAVARAKSYFDQRGYQIIELKENFLSQDFDLLARWRYGTGLRVDAIVEKNGVRQSVVLAIGKNRIVHFSRRYPVDLVKTKRVSPSP